MHFAKAAARSAMGAASITAMVVRTLWVAAVDRTAGKKAMCAQAAARRCRAVRWHAAHGIAIITTTKSAVVKSTVTIIETYIYI